MEEEFAIYSLDEVDLSRKMDEELVPPLHEQVARNVVFNAFAENDTHEEQYEEEPELESESRVVYPSDVQGDISDVFTKGVEPSIANTLSNEEIEFTFRNLKNRVKSLEIQNSQLLQQAENLELELNSTEDKFESQIADLKEKMDKERMQHKGEITELAKKHQEELQYKTVQNGKMEKVDVLKRDHDVLVMENQRLEARLEKAVGEQNASKTDLSMNRVELTKLKAEMTKLKSDLDATKAELSEKNSEIARHKRDQEQGKGTLDQQVKQLTNDKKLLEEQV